MPAKNTAPIRPTMPKLRTPTRLARGPKMYKSDPVPVGGPGVVPAGFLGNRNSAVEWMVYWALSKIFGNPIDPRVGPFQGGWPDWRYQDPTGAGSGVKGSVIDFVVYRVQNRSRPVLIRVVTEHFHLFTNAYTQGADAIQRTALEAMGDVVDLFDYAFTGDPTGQAVIVQCKQALGLIERPNPIAAGTAQRAPR